MSKARVEMVAAKEADTTYEGLIDVLARHVHERWRLESHPNEIDTFNSSQYQIPAGVLAKVRILRPLDNIGARYVFICEPDEFRRIAAENKDNGCSYDTVVMALIDVVELNYPGPVNENLIASLCDLGVCAPRVFEGPPPGTLINAVGNVNGWPANEAMTQIFMRQMNRPIWFKFVRGAFDMLGLIFRRVLRLALPGTGPSVSRKSVMKKTDNTAKTRVPGARGQARTIGSTGPMPKIPQWVRLSGYAWTEKKEYYEELGSNGKWAKLIR